MDFGLGQTRNEPREALDFAGHRGVRHPEAPHMDVDQHAGQIQAEGGNVDKRFHLVLLLYDPEQGYALPGEIAGVEREDRTRFSRARKGFEGYLHQLPPGFARRE